MKYFSLLKTRPVSAAHEAVVVFVIILVIFITSSRPSRICSIFAWKIWLWDQNDKSFQHIRPKGVLNDVSSCNSSFSNLSWCRTCQTLLHLQRMSLVLQSLVFYLSISWGWHWVFVGQCIFEENHLFYPVSQTGTPVSVFFHFPEHILRKKHVNFLLQFCF